MIILTHFLDFLGGKSEVFTVLVVKNGVDRKVVQSAENAFFCYTENTGQEAKGKIAVILKTSGKKVSHKENNVVVKSFAVTLLNGSIVLINNDDSLNAVMLVEQTGQCSQRHHHTCFFGISFQNIHKALLFCFGQFIACSQFIVAVVFLADDLGNNLIGFFPSIAFHILKGHKDNRIFALIVTVFLTARPNLFVLEVL